MGQPDEGLAYARGHREAFVEHLKELLRIPSVSTAPEHTGDMQRAAEWVAAYVKTLGFQNVQVMPTAMHPVVYGENLRAGAGKPTLLVYGHYDVQPAEPLELWTTGAFEPTQRGDNLYARGASDMKGQVVCFLKAVESLVKTSGEALPVNLKLMIEGEEEIGSPSLPAFLKEKKDLLKADLCLNGDGGIVGADAPSITYGLRGIAYFEIRLTGPATDLHSGIFGGAVQNPANVLAKLIAGMHDAEGRVTLPGFYDKVRALDADERKELNRLPTPDAWWIKSSGAPALAGEAGYTATERATARPTLDVNGIWGGFTGKGSKTVLPSKASAKVSMRLVPDQDPEAVYASLKAYLKQHAPPTVTWEIEQFGSVRAPIVDRKSRAVKVGMEALQKVWKTEPFFARNGGTVPVVSQIQDTLGIDSLMLGFGLPDDNLHAPNEKLHLPTFHRGVETYIHFLSHMG
ncbi:MAG: dipeptidase [Planctomycetota bacterium]|nr:dipeptidase [Planctomycetota bacterium]